MTTSHPSATHRLRIALHWASWCLWLPFGLLQSATARLGQRSRLPMQRTLLTALGLGAGLTLWVTTPILWGRIRLGFEAPPILRRPSTDEELQAALQHLVARVGLVHPLPSSDAFLVRHAVRGTFETREVTFDFTQDLTLLEMRLGAVRLHGTWVVARPEPTLPAPPPPDLP